MKKSLARLIFFRLMGWTIVGKYPDVPKLIVAVVPHSSYFDFIVAVLTRTILDKRIKFLGKKELFNPFTGLIFKFWGGIPIDREINKNYLSFTSIYILFFYFRKNFNMKTCAVRTGQ